MYVCVEGEGLGGGGGVYMTLAWASKVSGSTPCRFFNNGKEWKGF